MPRGCSKREREKAASNSEKKFIHEETEEWYFRQEWANNQLITIIAKSMVCVSQSEFKMRICEKRNKKEVRKNPPTKKSGLIVTIVGWNGSLYFRAQKE